MNEHFCCPECGPHVPADEDGCCATCGEDCGIEPCEGHVCGTLLSVAKERIVKLETEKAMLQEWATSMLDGPPMGAGFCRILLDYMKVLENKK